MWQTPKKIQIWQKLKTQNVATQKTQKKTQLKNPNCDKNLNFPMWQKQKQKHQILQNSKTQNVTKLKNSKCDKTQNVSPQKLKMWQISQTQNVTTPISKGKKNHHELKMWQKSKYDKIKKSDKTKKLKCD